MATTPSGRARWGGAAFTRIAGGCLVVVVLSMGMVFWVVWRSNRAGPAVRAFCESVKVGGPVEGLERRALAADLRASSLPAGPGSDGAPRVATVMVSGRQALAVGWLCIVEHADGRVTAARVVQRQP